MRISELLKAEQTRFVSLIDVLGILSDHDGGSEISESAQFLYLKLSTAPSETRPSWETIPCPLSGRRTIQSRTKQWDEARSLLERIASQDDKVYFSDEEFRKTQIYGFDRGEITAFMASCGANIEFNNAAVLEQSEWASPAAKADAEKPLGTTERNTLLTIIAALAKAAKINIDPPGKAAGFIEGLTDELGAGVSKRAIEEHLKKIPNALRTRMK